MRSSLFMYHCAKYDEGIMGKTQKEGKEYDLTLSCRFGVVECLRRRFG
jgi:hypothetical protein